MDRKFHYKASPLNYAAISVAGVAAVCLLRNNTAAGMAGGIWLAGAAALMAERVLHTAYVFTGDGSLHINRGWLARRTTIHVSDILSAEKIRTGVIPVRYVLVKYGAGHEKAVQPDDEEAFIEEIRRRQTQDASETAEMKTL